MLNASDNFPGVSGSRKVGVATGGNMELRGWTASGVLAGEQRSLLAVG